MPYNKRKYDQFSHTEEIEHYKRLAKISERQARRDARRSVAMGEREKKYDACNQNLSVQTTLLLNQKKSTNYVYKILLRCLTERDDKISSLEKDIKEKNIELAFCKDISWREPVNSYYSKFNIIWFYLKTYKHQIVDDKQLEKFIKSLPKLSIREIQTLLRKAMLTAEFYKRDTMLFSDLEEVLQEIRKQKYFLANYDLQYKYRNGGESKDNTEKFSLYTFNYINKVSGLDPSI